MLSINCPELCTNPERPPHGRAGGNPTPSRRESGPEPTEIRPRADRNPAPTPIPSPPLNTYLTHFPFGSDAAHPPLTPIRKSTPNGKFISGKLSLVAQRCSTSLSMPSRTTENAPALSTASAS